MTSTMAQTPQPGFLSAWVNAFTTFDEAHGFAVNLFVVAALGVTGAVFLSGLPRLIRPALIGFTVLCLADWVLIEDLGFLGGLGTDPNSMIPFVMLASGGYLALARVPAEAAEPAVAGAPGPGWRDRVRLARDRVRPQAVRRSAAAAGIGSVTAVGAIGLIVLGAAPMAVAQASPVADTILAVSINGASTPVNFPAPAFSLTDQDGRAVTLAGLRGKVVLLTFLDDTCSVDCPLIAQEFRQAGQLMGADTARVELVAINYNPLDTQVSYIQAFDQQEGLAGVPNWLYLTGTPAQLQQVWQHYAVQQAEILPAGSMVGHGDYAFVIDQSGHIRQELDFDTGPGTQATESSFAAELTDAARSCWGTHEQARPPGRRAGPGRRSAASGLRQPGSLRTRPRRRSPAGRSAVPGHVHGHRRRHLGGRRAAGRGVCKPGRSRHGATAVPRSGVRHQVPVLLLPGRWAAGPHS